MIRGAMREHGHVQSATGLGLHGHACWTFDDDDDLVRGSAEFLADGVRLGQRLVLVGPAEGLRARRDAILLREPLLARLELLELEAIHGGGRTDADAMLALYSAATEQALADGHSGLRVAAEVTALVADPDNHACHTRWESIADRYMASHPLAALCCYDRRALPAEVVGDLCAVHPVAHGPEAVAPFRLFAAPGALVVAGQVDYFSAGTLRARPGRRPPTRA